MSNMAYCRFENTVMDFHDCKEVLLEDSDTIDSDREVGHAVDLVLAAADLHNEMKGRLGVPEDGELDDEGVRNWIIKNRVKRKGVGT